MIDQGFTIVCKPQVPFSQRLNDHFLQHLTVAQLRKEAHDNRLDVSRLAQKWELVHVLVQEGLHGVKAPVEYVTDTKRRTIFDLPGEIRNKIYYYVLVAEHTILATYGLSPWPIPPWEASQVTPFVIECLRNLSLASRNLRSEARSLFFSHNRFEVWLSGESDYIGSFANIGADGCANMTVLDLPNYFLSKHNHVSHSVLRELTNLRNLKIFTDAKYIVEYKTYVAISKHTTLENSEWESDGYKVRVRRAINKLKLLQALQKLEIRCPNMMWTSRHRSGALRSATHGKVERAIEDALIEKMENGRLRHKGINIKVQIIE